MSNKIYGYARVSSRDQNLDRQLEVLRASGIDDRDIITNKQSGTDFNREGYITLKNSLLREGDTLVIKKLNPLGRDMEQIKYEWNALFKSGIDIIVMLSPKNKGLPLPNIIGMIPTIYSSIISAFIKASTSFPPPKRKIFLPTLFFSSLIILQISPFIKCTLS